MRTRRPRSTWSWLLAPLLLLPAVSSRASGPDTGPPRLLEPQAGERILQVGPAKNAAVQRAVAEALRRAYAGGIDSLRPEVPAPSLVMRRGVVEAAFAPFDVHFTGLDVSGIALRGRIRIEGLALDYGAFGLGRLVIVETPRLTPVLESTLVDVDAYLKTNGFQDTFVEEDAAGGIALGGRRPIRVLVFRTTPLVRIVGRFLLEGTTLGFVPDEVEVSDTSGPVASAIQKKIRGQDRRLDFADLFEGFEQVRVSVAEGRLEVVDQATPIYAQPLEIPAGPTG